VQVRESSVMSSLGMKPSIQAGLSVQAWVGGLVRDSELRRE